MLQKFLLLILIPVFSHFLTEEDLIEWSASRKLTWADFKGKPDPTSSDAALTNSAINVEFGFNNKGLTYSIRCRFNKSLSWGRIKNDYILNHEQGHFDIAEAHARILHKNLIEYVFKSRTVSSDINKIYNDVMNQHVLMQKQYDIQTSHSLDSAQQLLWDNKISAMLIEYGKFAEYR